MSEEKTNQKVQGSDALSRVAEKISKSENVLITLSKDPSVDELAAAIGLTMMLDDTGKHATAIFSGQVPNALEFLEPEKTLEKNTNSLQDFIIALNKEKADHLRYKIEGDYVKVFITPYKSTIDEKDLEFSHGDFNVDLVIAIDVASTNDLDAALYEHGRIMHNASSINIAAGMPGNFGDIEWGDPGASSVSEMICDLEMRLRGEDKKTLMSATVATAFLTGIVAATDRFSNEKTSPNVMSWAAKLMEAGADQQMVSANIKDEIGVESVEQKNEETSEQSGKLKVEKNDDTEVVQESEQAEAKEEEQKVTEVENQAVEAPIEEASEQIEVKEEVQESEPAEAQAEQNLPEVAPVETAETPNVSGPEIPSAATSEAQVGTEPTLAPGIISHGGTSLASELGEMAISSDMLRKDYSAEIEKELAEPLPAPMPVENPAMQAAPTVDAANNEAALNDAGVPINYSQGPMGEMPAIVAPVPGATGEPAAQPQAVQQAPVEVNVPNGELVTPPLPMPDAGVLPPPPPPFDPNQQVTSDMMPQMQVEPVMPVQPVQNVAPVQQAPEYVAPVAPAPVQDVAAPVMPQPVPIQPAAPTPEQPARYLGENPAMADQVYPQTAPPADPGAFMIPGAQ